MYQTVHAVVRRDVRSALLEVAGGPPGCGGCGSVVFRAAAALYALLLEHGVDRRGRCLSCRRPASRVGPQRRRCRVYLVAQHWLGQPRTALLVSDLAGELGLPVASALVAGSGPDRPGFTVTGRTPEKATEAGRSADRDDTEDLFRIVLDVPGSRSGPVQAPAASCLPSLPVGGLPPARRPDPDHGGVGEYPDCPRPHRGPSTHSPFPGAARALVTGAAVGVGSGVGVPVGGFRSPVSLVVVRRTSR